MRAHIRDTEIFFDIDGAARVPDESRMRDLRIFEHSGHAIALDEPKPCLDAIAGFLGLSRKEDTADAH